MSRDHQLNYQLFPLGSLMLLCMTNLLFQFSVVVDAVESSMAFDMDGTRNGSVISFGDIRTGGRSMPSGVIFLALKVPDSGTMFKTTAYFSTNKPVYLQLWRPDKGQDFNLIHQMIVQSDTPNATKSIYLYRESTRRNHLECLRVHKDDQIGLFGLNEPLPITIHVTSSAIKTKASNTESLPEIGSTVTFSSLVFPYTFSIEVFIWKDGGGSSKFGRCPMHLISPLNGSTNTMTTTATTTATSTAITTATTTATTIATTTIAGTTQNTTLHPRTAFPVSSTLDELVTAVSMESTAGEESLKAMPAILGGVIAVAVVAIVIVVVVVFVVYRRRRQKRDSGLGAKSPTSTTGCQSISSNVAIPSFANPAYSSNCDLMDTYEVLDRPPTQAPNLYHPIIPRRPGLTTAPSGEIPTPATTPSSERPSAANNNKSRIMTNPSGRAKGNTAPKPARNGRKLPEIPQKARQESTDYIDSKRSPDYLDLI